MGIQRAGHRGIRRKHLRFLRKIVGITIYDVEDHHISNEQVQEELSNYYTFHQSLELKVKVTGKTINDELRAGFTFMDL